MYQVTKHYGHWQGLSCTFRQWRAESHCRYLHGYAIAVEIVFEAPTLDVRNWVADFGSLKPIKAWLEDNYDHKLLIASDDPEWEALNHLAALGLAQARTVKATGCEAIAKEVFDFVSDWLANSIAAGDANKHCKVVKVIAKEHEGNAAAYVADNARA